MGGKKNHLLGDLELQIMGVVWDRKDVSVSDVVEGLKPKRPLHHNTVMTVLSRLAKKGFLKQYRRDGRTCGYTPLKSKDEVSSEYMDMITNSFFNGSVAETVMALLGSGKVKKSAVKDLRKKLNQQMERK